MSARSSWNQEIRAVIDRPSDWNDRHPVKIQGAEAGTGPTTERKKKGFRKSHGCDRKPLLSLVTESRIRYLSPLTNAIGYWYADQRTTLLSLAPLGSPSDAKRVQ